MKQLKKKIAVIGGGASGIVAAIEAKKAFEQADVTIFEKLPKLCKKILVTGNGRCNFTNEDLSPHHFYGSYDFLRKILISVFSDSENYFRSLGVLSYHEDSRIYPRAQQSAVIREALVKHTESLNINIKTDTQVTSLKATSNGFLVNGELYNAVIVSTGGKAAAVHGSDGSIFPVIKALNHTLTPLYPALCGLKTEGTELNVLKGVRAEAKAALYCGSKLLAEEAGEVQFTDKGISGIPVMNLSHLCKDNKELTIRLDLCPEICEAELREHISEATRSLHEAELETALSGIVNTKLAYAVMSKAKIKQGTQLCKLSTSQISTIISILKCFVIKITGTKGFDNAQITCGGISTNEINPETMMSKIHNGLFFCGEILDIHGDCGGYNLHLAWTTGRIAGTSAAEYIRNSI